MTTLDVLSHSPQVDAYLQVKKKRIQAEALEDSMRKMAQSCEPPPEHLLRPANNADITPGKILWKDNAWVEAGTAGLPDSATFLSTEGDLLEISGFYVERL